MNFAGLPKIELHCHLDGSIHPEAARQELLRQGMDLSGEDLLAQLTVTPDCRNLQEYLDCFALPLKCVQTWSGLEESAYRLCRMEAEDGVRYFETRFAPSSCLENGLTVPQAIEAVRKGLLRGREAFGIRSGLICCGMRHLSSETNLAMAREARAYLGSGVVALDIAGGEAGHNNRELADFFAYARSVDFPMTIHSGECGSAENVREAIELGARRIGHGIAIAGHRDIMQLCRDRRIALELCPTSNIQTRAISRLADYPIKDFAAFGIPLSVNTDNRTVSGTTLTREWELLDKEFAFTEEFFRQIYRDCVEASFASDEDKEYMLQVDI